MTKNKASDVKPDVPLVSISNSTFTGYKVDANVTELACKIADAVAEIARSNAAAADVLEGLSNRFAAAQFESLLRIDGDGVAKLADLNLRQSDVAGKKP